MFDHVGIAVADLAASERFYRTVLSVLGAEPSHADAELVEWDDWAIGPTDREHPVTRGLHVGFRAPSREAVDAFWQAGIDAGYRDGRVDHLWIRVRDPRRVQALLSTRPRRRSRGRKAVLSAFVTGSRTRRRKGVGCGYEQKTLGRPRSATSRVDPCETALVCVFRPGEDVWRAARSWRC
jgi:catechol 2,3-dioxygenase-like lactoylglutathione lyase family enzyme